MMITMMTIQIFDAGIKGGKISVVFPVKLYSGEWHKTSLMIINLRCLHWNEPQVPSFNHYQLFLLALFGWLVDNGA